MPHLEERKSILSREDNDWIWFFASGKDTGQGASWPKSEPPFRGRDVGLALSILSPCRQYYFSTPEFPRQGRVQRFKPAFCNKFDWYGLHSLNRNLNLNT